MRPHDQWWITALVVSRLRLAAAGASVRGGGGATIPLWRPPPLRRGGGRAAPAKTVAATVPRHPPQAHPPDGWPAAGRRPPAFVRGRPRRAAAGPPRGAGWQGRGVRRGRTPPSRITVATDSAVAGAAAGGGRGRPPVPMAPWAGGWSGPRARRARPFRGTTVAR